MSNAANVAQARQEFIADLRRLKPNRDNFTEELEQQGQALIQKAQRRRQLVAESANSYLAANKASVDAYVDADLSAQGE